MSRSSSRLFGDESGQRRVDVHDCAAWRGASAALKLQSSSASRTHSLERTMWSCAPFAATSHQQQLQSSRVEFGDFGEIELDDATL